MGVEQPTKIATEQPTSKEMVRCSNMRFDAQSKCAFVSTGPEVRTVGSEPVGATRECDRKVQATPAHGEGDRTAWQKDDDRWRSAKASKWPFFQKRAVAQPLRR